MNKTVELFVQSVKNNLSAEDLVAFESCLDCRHCGTACAWYLSTEDERLHPKYKKDFIRRIYKRFLTLEGRLAGFFHLTKTPTVEELREHMEAFWKCTACGRCSLACPLNLSTRSLVRLARTAYNDAGLTVENPVRKSILKNTRESRHSFGLSREQVYLRFAFFFMNEKVEIPIGVPNADYYFICPTAGNTRFPDYAIQVPQLLNAAGVSYTVSPAIVDTGTEIDHIVSHHELSKRMLMEIEDEAERLGARNFLIAECGCDIRTFHVEAAQRLGREFKLPVRSLDSLLLESIRAGRLPVRKIDTPVTLHDPCYVTRLSGMGETIRELLREAASHFTEMSPSREFNYCCNGGSGPLRLPENTELRRRVSRFKVNQILASKAEWVVTPCAVCMLTLDDICRYYQLSPGPGRMVYMLFEIVYRAVAAALAERGEIRRLKKPALFEHQPPEFIRRHSFAGVFSELAGHPQFMHNLQWLESDDIVQRYLQAHPEAAGLLQALKSKAEAWTSLHASARGI